MYSSKILSTLSILSFAICVSVSLTGSSNASIVDLIVNGDFSNGETGWTDTNDIGTVQSNALEILGGTSPEGEVRQDVSPVATTTPTQVCVDFVTSDPTSSRSFNMFLRSSNGGQVNVRVTPGGGLQIFDNAHGNSWTNLGLTANVDGMTTNTLCFDFNTFGNGSLDYDVDLNGTTATGLNLTQTRELTDLDEIVFSNDFGEDPFTIDNVSVCTVPEPSSTALLAMAALCGISVRRRSNR